MNIEYADERMKKDFEDRRRLRKKYLSCLPGLENRLSELRAANNLGDISHNPPPERHKLNGNWDGCWGIRVTRNYRLIVRPLGSFNIDDLSSINSIKIETLTDYH